MYFTLLSNRNRERLECNYLPEQM
uniref:Uncharacterized protein n=1 Tax=Arundo donax TaxID=35708 RepID=A0A0A8YBR5_ARUDO